MENVTYVGFHGSVESFGTFSLKNLGKNGTSEGFGIYLTDNIDFANVYAVRNNRFGFIYVVEVALEKALSFETKTITKPLLRKWLNHLDKTSDILSNFGEVAYSGRQNVMNEAIELLMTNDNDVDLVNELGTIVGDKEFIAEVVYQMGGFTHTVVSECYEGDINVVVVLDPKRIKIKERRRVL